MVTVKKRLQIQRRGLCIDRSLLFVIGTVTESERKKLRGVFFEVANKIEANRLFSDLHQLGWEAAGEGRAAEFLDGLDQ